MKLADDDAAGVSQEEERRHEARADDDAAGVSQEESGVMGSDCRRGALSASIARELVDNHHDVTLIERNAEHVEVDSIPAAHWHLGDACELSLLEAVHLEAFDVVVAATGDDKANVVLSLLAKTGSQCLGWCARQRSAQ